MSDGPSADFQSARRAQLLVLVAELERLTADAADSRAAVTLDQTAVGRLSRMDAMQRQAIAQEAGRRREQSITLARFALKRLDSGDYGDCTQCGNWINPKRLEMDPAARWCLNCAEASEV